MPTSAKGFVTPSGSPDDNDNIAAIQTIAERLDAILSSRNAAAVTALAGTDLWTGRAVRQTDGTGTAQRQQSGLYLYDGSTWQPGIGDGLGGTATGPGLTAASVNPNMGTSPTLAWDWWMMGDWCVGQLIIVWGTGSPTGGTGELIISLPVASAAWASPAAALAVPLGHGIIKDVSAGTGADVTLITAGSTTSARLAYHGAAGGVKATGATPVTLGAAGDFIKVTFSYLT